MTHHHHVELARDVEASSIALQEKWRILRGLRRGALVVVRASGELGGEQLIRAVEYSGAMGFEFLGQKWFRRRRAWTNPVRIAGSLILRLATPADVERKFRGAVNAVQSDLFGEGGGR